VSLRLMARRLGCVTSLLIDFIRLVVIASIARLDRGTRLGYFEIVCSCLCQVSRLKDEDRSKVKVIRSRYFTNLYHRTLLSL
jgi:hypothetical protein